MADAKYMSITVTTTAQTFSNSDTNQQFIFQAPAGNTNAITVCPAGDTAVDGLGLQIEPGKDIPSHQVPTFMRNGPFSVIVGSSTETLTVVFAQPRTPAS